MLHTWVAALFETIDCCVGTVSALCALMTVITLDGDSGCLANISQCERDAVVPKQVRACPFYCLAQGVPLASACCMLCLSKPQPLGAINRSCPSRRRPAGHCCRAFRGCSSQRQATCWWQQRRQQQQEQQEQQTSQAPWRGLDWQRGSR